MKWLAKILLIVCGTFFTVLGILGIFLPLLPATPFFLVAAACYARSSQTFYNLLLNNKWFGQYIKNWREGKGIPLKTKILSVSLLILTINYSVFFVVRNFIAQFFLILIAIEVTIYIIYLPNFRDKIKNL